MVVRIGDVAARAGVSVGTVSNVLNRPDKVSPATAKRVHAAVRELGFVPNDAARRLRSGRSRSIGLVVLDIGNPFFTDLARGAERRAAEDGHTVLLANSDDSAERERAHLEQFEEQQVRGVLLSPLGDVRDVVARLRQRGIPSVLVDRRAGDIDVSSVFVDDVAGGRMAARHLLETGRRRLAFVGGPRGLRQVDDRLRGARAAVAETPGATLEVLETSAPAVLPGRDAGVALRDRAPADRPDGVVAANDLVAVGVLQALTMLGRVRVPDDVALVGYDDIDFAQSAVVPLTSVRQPSARIGATGIELLLREADGGVDAPREHVEFQPELVVRASSVRG